MDKGRAGLENSVSIQVEIKDFFICLFFFNGVVVQNQKHNLQNSRFSL